MFDKSDEMLLTRVIKRAEDAMLAIASDQTNDSMLSQALVSANIIDDALGFAGIDCATTFLREHPELDLVWAGRNAAIHGVEKALGIDPDSAQARLLVQELYDYFRTVVAICSTNMATIFEGKKL